MEYRIKKWYQVLGDEGLKKFIKHAHKGDWRDREDKTLGYLMSGLIIEVGELQKALSRDQGLEDVLSECGDILNYLVMIADTVKQQKD